MPASAQVTIKLDPSDYRFVRNELEQIFERLDKDAKTAKAEGRFQDHRKLVERGARLVNLLEKI